MQPFARADVEAGGGQSGVDFHIGTPHGAAMWTAVIAFVVVAFFVGRGRGLLGGAVAAVGFIVLIKLADLAGGYALHSWTVSHADSPVAQGLSFNASGL